jgi:hypothetical protein
MPGVSRKDLNSVYPEMASFGPGRCSRIFAILNVARYACYRRDSYACYRRDSYACYRRDSYAVGCKNAAAFSLRLKASPRHVS